MKESPRSPARPTEGKGACVDSARRKRREKMLDAGEVRLLMLHFLSQGATWGYELIKSIEDLSRGEYTPSPGIIYPNLSLLEESELIQVGDPLATRKCWRLTAAGERHLSANQQPLERIITRLGSLAVLVNNRSIPEMERAIHNFKMALNGRLSQPHLSRESLYNIIDILDDAAKKIERS